MSQKEASLEVITCGISQVYKIKMPDEDLENLKLYAAEVLSSWTKYADYTYNLAGHIKKGKQLRLPDNEDRLKNYYAMLSEASADYYHTYLNRIGKRGDPSYEIKAMQLQDTWLNSYYEGDYNPNHDHGTLSPIGLSSFTFLNTPDCIKSVHDLENPHISANEPDVLDGHTVINWGYSYNSADQQVESLQFEQGIHLYPEEGTTYIFPKWMDHQVYPFRGEGVRISMATNVSIWPAKYQK